MNRFELVSALDARYYLESDSTQKALGPYLSEEARIHYMALAELAWVKTLFEHRTLPSKAIAETEKAVNRLTAERAYEMEKKTRHDIRAIVDCLREDVSAEVRPFIHLGATSYDIVDTANAARLRDATTQALIPRLVALEKTLLALCRAYAKTPETGRTHGQYAVPITFGFALSNSASRLSSRILALDKAAQNLRGKASGAVGGYHALGLVVQDPARFEIDYLKKMNLSPANSSTQICEPEFMTDLFHAYVTVFGVLADLSDDLRHLQRSEISEIGESFGETQVGSSTMPQKRNPINFENVKSFWKAFMPRMTSVYMDQLSEHQRDLTNSASGRFHCEIITALFLSAERLDRSLAKLRVDAPSMEKNLAQASINGGAEPLYILLALAGHPDAHEAVRQLTLASEKEKIPLYEALVKNPSLAPYLKKIPAEQLDLIKNPQKYLGRTREKTLEICDACEKALADYLK